MSILNIWVLGVHAATLIEKENVFSLLYTDEWRDQNGYAFAPCLPVDQNNSGVAVRNFFSNLLPEGQMLDGLSQAHQISKFDVFGILRKIGRDCAGALVLLEPGEVPEADQLISLEDYQKIDSSELNERIAEANVQNTPLMYWKSTPRMSLAGVQNKLGVYLDQDESIYLPKATAPTSHILKPESLNQERHPSITANEYFCMQLAYHALLDVPDTRYKKLPSPIYLVKRYDRVWLPGGRLVRTHQIDGCQALNLPPNLKYEQEYPESPKGATLADILQMSSLCKVPVEAQKKIIFWILFNYLIGNTDAHAKNISFLINESKFEGEQLTQQSGIQVAPFYDLVSGTIYGYKEMAQSIGGEFEFAIIGTMEWKKFAKDTGVHIKVVQEIARILLKRIEKVLPRVATQVAEQTRSNIVSEITKVILKHREYLRQSLLS